MPGEPRSPQESFTAGRAQGWRDALEAVRDEIRAMSWDDPIPSELHLIEYLDQLAARGPGDHGEKR